jgi:hypothetical protein
MTTAYQIFSHSFSTNHPTNYAVYAQSQIPTTYKINYEKEL